MTPEEEKQAERIEAWVAFNTVRNTLMNDAGIDYWQAMAAVIRNRPYDSITKMERQSAKDRYFTVMGELLNVPSR